jgi:hypothetical protein
MNVAPLHIGHDSISMMALIVMHPDRLPARVIHCDGLHRLQPIRQAARQPI